MEVKEKAAANNELVKSNFGSWGWSMIIVTFLFYYFWAGVGTDGLNLYPNAFANTYGWDPHVLLAFATPAGIIGIIGTFIFSALIIKLKPRMTAGITIILTGICYVLFGMAQSVTAYFIILSLFTFFCQGFGLSAPPTLMANWFPRRKGIALGWATIGAPFCTATFVAGLSALLGNFGITTAFAIAGGVIILFGIISFFWVKNYPEEVGAYPDNIKDESATPRASMQEIESYKSPFTVGKLLKDKDMWLISLGFGMLWMVTIGIVSQFVPRMMSVGYTLGDALTLLTVSALIACPGSYFWGWLDQKTSTKTASVVYAASYIIALILLILQLGTVTTWIACIFVGLGLGGLLNLMPSLAISVYGRYDFMAVNRLISPISSLIRVFAFVIMASLLAASGGSYTVPYIVFIVIDIIGAALILCVTNKCKGKTE
jgi:OFA family oxalate/formate antiporter-like MFS transporter